MTLGYDAVWISWDQAAQIVGCPVPTIDWHTRTGRIKTRPHHGNRPTIDAASLEEFKAWWQSRDHREVPARRKRRPARPERPEGWMKVETACEVLSLSESTVRYHVRRGDLESMRQGRYVWLSETSVREYAEDRAGRMSQEDAARLCGCSRDTITLAVKAGKIVQHEVTNRSRPSLDRKSVEAFKAERDAKRARREEERAEEARIQAELGPPKDGEVWFTTAVVAAMFGVSTSWVRSLARDGRLPHYEAPGGKRYFRRDHVERVGAVRAMNP